MLDFSTNHLYNDFATQQSEVFFMETIGERIKIVRKEKGLTQQTFADKLGLKRNTIGSYEIDAGLPSDRTISDICREFGVNEIWLRTGDGEPFQQESREEQIMRFAAQTVKGSDEFRKAFVSMLTKMDADDWENIGKLFAKLADEIEKK